MFSGYTLTNDTPFEELYQCTEIHEGENFNSLNVSSEKPNMVLDFARKVTSIGIFFEVRGLSSGAVVFENLISTNGMLTK